MEQSAAQQARNKLGGAIRQGAAETAENARRALAVAKLEAHIREVVSGAPPLTAEDAAMLRGLLPAPASPAATAGGGADAA